MPRRLPAVFVLCLLMATAASAQLSKEHKEWREGPVQWIMTPEEQRAWKNVKTDAEATAFIDLFWARRDPTRGTFQNEARAEHEGRVILADERYTEKGKRGALTERGRAFIVLGPPSQQTKEIVRANSSHNDTASLGGTGRLTGGREEWFYKREITGKWGIPEAYVVFVTNPQTGRVMRDVQRTDFIGAATAAIKYSILNPDITTVPEWAARGGLNPIAFKIVPAVAPGVPAPEEPAAATPAVPGSSTVRTETAVVPFSESFEPKGASRLTLTRNVYEIDAESKADPFVKLPTADAFKASEELGWAAQVCTASNDEPTVRYQLRLTGNAAGEVIDRVAEPDELVPDRIRALAGCYMLRGAVPLEGMSPGDYQLEVSIYDPEKQADTVLKKAFRIE